MSPRTIWRSKNRSCDRRTRASKGDDSGFTLIELIIVIVILPIIIGGIAAAVIVSLNDQIGLSTKLSDSHDTQLTSSFFGRDVQSAQAITTSSAATLCGTGTQVLGLKLQPTNTTTSYVSYVTTSGNSPEIVRNFCSTGSPATSAISHDVSTATPTVTSSANSSSICSSFSAANTLVPSFCIANVALKITEKSGFFYSLTASPRQESLGGGGGPPNPPSLLLLGSGGANCQGSGSGTLNVNGTAAINSTSPGSVSGNYTVNASNVYSQSSSPIATTPPGQATTYNSSTTQPQSMGPQVPDPYADLPDPTGPTETYSGGALLPGDYKTAVTINGSIPTLATGIYIFEQGLSVGGGGSISAPAGVLFFIGIPNAAPSTPQPASFKVSGSGFVNLTAMSSGPYQGIAIFQARTDSNQMVVTGGGTASSYQGLIYAPDANVNTGGGGGLSTGGIVASSLTCGGNGAVLIGPSASATKTSITSNSGPTVSGQSASFTATVISPGNFTPVGDVEFLANGTPIASCGGANGQELSNGQASCTTTSLVASGSPYTVKAQYLIPNPNAGDAWLTNFYQSSFGTVSQTVSKAGTTTSLASSGNPSSVGQQITYTATVSVTTPGAGTPSSGDTVTFNDGVSPISCAAGSQAFNGTTATCLVTYTSTSGSPHSITATFGGDASFSGSTSSPPLSQTVVTGTVPQISGFTEAPNGGSHQKYSGTTNVASGTITINVCAGSAPCTSGWVKQYTGIAVTSLSWSFTTTGSDPLTNGQTYTATATQTANGITGPSVSTTFTGN